MIYISKVEMEFEHMKNRVNVKTRNEQGITLIALIRTIIILVILASVAIKSLMDSRIIEVAGDGTRKLCNRTKK